LVAISLSCKTLSGIHSLILKRKVTDFYEEQQPSSTRNDKEKKTVFN
jgi:hypothetical protein